MLFTSIIEMKKFFNYFLEKSSITYNLFVILKNSVQCVKKNEIYLKTLVEEIYKRKGNT